MAQNSFYSPDFETSEARDEGYMYTNDHVWVIHKEWWGEWIEMGRVVVIDEGYALIAFMKAGTFECDCLWSDGTNIEPRFEGCGTSSEETLAAYAAELQAAYTA